MPGYKVSGKPFAGMEKGEATAVFWRPGAGRSLVGIRVVLAEVSEERVRELVEHAWRNKAPKRVIAAYDGT